ncbi:LysR family transcriptional regulator [Mesobaculum littorinae]|uniref:LysR family transcriptional regulator n=1 Tax=Mesobaculum littorinae TaxID=2486419 RepID=A0A438AEN2_9RHOB|nr:LysR family transcriptional regulator [Mesobaculum littorinae]RVV97166.1 LysR family transcriptional regulator [Mesobaculum littorinae]
MIEGPHFAELRAFVAVYETLNFRIAALRLGVTPSALSRTIRRLEERLGVRLFNRTTRSVSPTGADLMLYDRLIPAMSALQEAVGSAVAEHGAPVGTIQINLPRLAAELCVLPHLPAFARDYPGVKLELVINDALSDVVEKGFDAGIRIGDRLAQDMIAIRLTPPIRAAVVGSREYLEEFGTPEVPHDLARHRCLAYRWSETGQLGRWAFDGPEGKLDVQVDGPVVLNDTGLIRNAAMRGLGLAYLAEEAVAVPIAEGRLVRVLEDWCKPVPGFYLYHPSRRQTPPGLRALIASLRKGMKG